MFRIDLHDRRNFFPTNILRTGAARTESAAFRRIHRTRHVAGQEDPLSSACLIDRWDRRKECLRVRMRRTCIKLRARRHFDDLPQIHDGHTVRNVLNDREVMGNEKIRQTAFFAQFHEKINDLGLDRNVQSRDRLIQDQEFRLRIRARAMQTR